MTAVGTLMKLSKKGFLSPVSGSHRSSIRGQSYESRRVVITGMGSVNPLGVNVDSSWKALLNGVSAIRSITDDLNDEDEEFGKLYEGLPSRVAGRVERKSFEKLRDDIVGKKEVRTMSRMMVFTLIATDESLKDAKLPIDKDLDRVGVAVGNGMVDLTYIGDSDRRLRNGGGKLSPYFVPKILPNLNPGHVSLKYGFKGPLHSVSTACATGSHAIGDAYNFIKTDAADVMIAGGTDSSVSPLSVAGFCKARALSFKFNESPMVASRPFDKDRDGFVISEGCGILVLEELQHALERNADIYGEVVGYGLSGDAYHITAGREDGDGALKAMLGATKGLLHLPDEKFKLKFVNCHATSTPKGDKAEVKAIKRFVQHNHDIENLYLAGKVWLSSNKGNVGHLLGGAGSLESIFALKSLKTGEIPDTLNAENLDEDFDMDDRMEIALNNQKMASEADGSRNLVIKNSFGFGGTNVTLLFAEYK